MPSRPTVCRWLMQREDFRNQYARAREEQADALFDEVVAIADMADAESVQQARLRIDARKWVAGKLRPKVYGDKVLNEHSGPDGEAIPHRVEVVFGKQT